MSPGVKSRTRYSPPPPPSSLRLRSNSPILISPFLSPPGQSSLDFVDSGRVLQDEQSVNDNTSVISGPFAEVDEVSPIFSPISDRKESEETSSTLSRNRYNSVSTSLGEEYVNITSQQKEEGLYASIPANDDDAYLTMKSGGSIEDLLETTPGKMGIMKRLQFVTSKSEMDTSPISSSPRRTTSVGSPSRIPRGSDVSIRSAKSIISGIETVKEESPSGSPILTGLTGRFPPRQMSTTSMRPLPPSPNKPRRSESSLRKRKSSTGHNNIYESIDEDGADWLQQLKKRILARQKMEDKGNLFGSELALQCNQILEHFLSTPEVQKLWMASVETVFPGFQLLEDFDIPPFSVNPEYFAQHVKSKRKVQSVIETNEAMTSEESTKHETKPSSEHHKLSMTDSLLVQMNQQLRQSSSDESDEGSYISEDVTSDVGGVDTLDSRTGTSLSSIHQQFSPQETPGIQDEEAEEEEYSSEESDDDTQKTEVVRHVLKVEDNGLLQSSELQNNANVSIHIDQEVSGGEDSPLPDNSAQFNTKTHSNAIHLLSGHLDATHLNSLDSGISAYGSNGTDDC